MLRQLKGLRNKYVVTKADGSDVGPDANYFVMRVDTDKHAVYAMQAYAHSVKHDNPKLSKEIELWLKGFSSEKDLRKAQSKQQIDKAVKRVVEASKGMLDV